MSDLFKSALETILAAIGINDGANKGFWRRQPRNSRGRWIEMGAELKAMLRNERNEKVPIVGNYVGPGNAVGTARLLVEGDSSLPDGAYDIDSHLLDPIEAILPEDFIESKGVSTDYTDIFGNKISISDDQIPTVDQILATRQDITDQDRRYAKGELTDEERNAEALGREESPIATMPGGFESLNREEASKLLEDAGASLDQVRPQSEAEKRMLRQDDERRILEQGQEIARKVAERDQGINRVPVFDPTALRPYETFRPYDGSGRFDPRINRENALKTEERRKIEKDLGRNLTPEEVSALGLTHENPDIARRYENVEFIIPGRETPEQIKRFKDAEAKRHAIRKRIKAELEGKKLENKDAAADAKVREAYQDAFEGGTPSLDSLENESLALARELDRETESKPAIDLDRGDILVGPDGVDYVVTDIKRSERGSDFVNVTIQSPEGVTGTYDYPVTREFDVVKGRRGSVVRPQQPRSRTEPEAPTQEPTQETPSEDVVEEDVDTIESFIEENSDVFKATDEGLSPPSFPPSDRLDDGSEFELPVLSDEELEDARRTRLTPIMGPDGLPVRYVDEFNNIVDADDPFSMLAALARVYPNARFTPSGALILHRQRDKDGRIFELRATNSGKRAIIYSMRWTDPETGEFKEYQHKDDRHSVKALFTGSNGPQGLMDRLLGRVDNKGKDWGDPANYKFGNTRWKRDDSLFKRLGWFMSGTGDRQKMEEIGKNAVRLAEGNQAIYHNDSMVLKHQEIPNLFEAFDEWFSSGPDRQSRDAALREDLFHVLYGVFGRAPMGEDTHRASRVALRAEFARQFPNASLRMTQSFNGIITAASERMRGIYRTPDPETRAIKYASKDRTRAIERNQVVEYTNNVGDTSTLRVTDLVQNIGVTPGNTNSQYDYGDYVVVIDSNGNKRVINALKLRILEDQNKSLTEYIANLRGEDLARRRREIEGIPEPTGTAGEPVRIRPAVDLSIPEEPAGVNTVQSDPPPPPMLIDDFIAGDMLYNKAGQPLGIIKTSPRPVTGRDGSPGLAFLYTKADGTEGTAVYKLGTEIRPKKA